MHLMEPAHPNWETRLVFRDYLRAYPEAVRTYADIKRALAASAVDDIVAYTAGKNSFVKDTTEKAFAWRARMRARVMK